ncbi:hypothetical protein E3N88_03960 [Mikania micrantha]|uniref:Uncharacterized protein n=1 Tax=Mikania micrantha TaxID=192012 RepID=A0A5N6PTK5_9ASTR|nr:hypothetical protein E3N88_03960 [Mikania micrantha]
MAPQVSSKLVLVLFFIILLIVPSSGTSRGHTMLQPEHRRKHNDAVSNNPSLLFNMLPKGKPVPPSGPSKRHNSVPSSQPPASCEWLVVTAPNYLQSRASIAAPDIFDLKQRL